MVSCKDARSNTNHEKQSNIEERARCNNNLLIYKISSTCFGQSFVHHQERRTDILQHMASCKDARSNTNHEKQSNIEERTRCNNNLLIYKISSTCFGQSFAHHQERRIDILQHMASCKDAQSNTNHEKKVFF